MQNPLSFRRLSVPVVVLLVLFSFVACKSAPKSADSQASAPGWEVPPDVPPASGADNNADIEDIRRKNRELSDRVTVLSEQVKEIQAEEGVPAAAAVAAPGVEPAPTVEKSDAIDAARLEAAIRKAGISDLEVGSTEADDVFVRLSGGLAFRAGSADLMSSARTRLKRLVEVLRSEFPDVSLRIDGHTDSDPIRKSKWTSNNQLSSARAGAVAKFFVQSLGWSDSRVTSRGYGSEAPVATNSTREGKAQNRRIEIVLLP